MKTNQLKIHSQESDFNQDKVVMIFDKNVL